MRYVRVLLLIFKSRLLKRKENLNNPESLSRVREIEFALDSFLEPSDLDVMELEEICIEEFYLTRERLPELRKFVSKARAEEIRLLLDL